MNEQEYFEQFSGTDDRDRHIPDIDKTQNRFVMVYANMKDGRACIMPLEIDGDGYFINIPDDIENIIQGQMF